ncbi:MAG: adenylosuccinate synthetase, partial [Candidatus Sungbacteria bacterium]|nr:adenylosuccinate synthetase [Candidatus Sungbacteria bacterium]
MPATIVVGLQWGDEGKGKIVDMLANSGFHAVVRFGGGNNAGHTIHNEHGKFALHLVPAGIFNPDTLNIIERGVVVHPTSLVKEMDELAAKNISLSNLKISPFSHMVMPWHLAEDKGRETAGNNSSGNLAHLGTTLRGIGPCYQDKAGRWQAFRVGDLLNRSSFLEKLEKVYGSKKSALEAAHGSSLPSLEDIRREYIEAADRIVPYIGDTTTLIRKTLLFGQNILCEGAQGTLLDVDFGSYPYVTSSNTTSMAACMLTGINPSDVSCIIGVAKAYVTRVGDGPFPTKMDEVTERTLRDIGKEYGATTGRPRLCGWLDLPLLSYACKINHVS